MNGFLALFGIFFFIVLIICIALYVVYSYSLYKMAMKQGIENSWLAFIPIAQYYIIGKLIKTLKVFDYLIPQIEVVLPLATVAVMVFGRIAFIGTILWLANYILVLFALNKLYKLYKPENATLYTILSIFGITVPFIFLSIKELDQVVDSSNNNY